MRELNSFTPIQREIVVVFALVLGALSAGYLLGDLSTALLLAISAYLLWHLRQLVLMVKWLERPKKNPLPTKIGIWHEISDGLLLMRQKEKKSKRKLSALLSGFKESTSALPDATVVLNEAWEVEWWNRASSHYLGFTRKGQNEQPLHQAITDPVLHRYIQKGDYRRPLQMPSPVDNNLILEVRIVPYSKGRHLLQARDISRLLQLETVRRDFVGNVSHEMRTPLTVVYGYLESMLDYRSEGLQPWIGIIQKMQQQTERMRRIVEDLLLLSRVDSESSSKSSELVKVDELLQLIKQEAEALSGEENHRISVEAEADLCLSGNISELQSAFSNLVFNAVRYTPAGGEIRIRWWQNGTAPCFSVTDSGIGIAEEHIPRLTERFYRVDVGRSRERGGTGLGLAIVKHVMLRHGGALEIDSELGEGSTFMCCFPASRITPPPVEIDQVA